MKVKIRSISPHMPVGEVQEVEIDKAKKLVDSGSWEYVDEESIDTIKDKVSISEDKKEKKLTVDDIPDESWKEKEIKKWIKENKLPIKYHISSDTKRDIILRIKDYLENR